MLIQYKLAVIYNFIHIKNIDMNSYIKYVAKNIIGLRKNYPYSKLICSISLSIICL